MSRAPWNNVLHSAAETAGLPPATAPAAVGLRRMQPPLQRAVAPVLDMDVDFLIELADGGRRHLTAPKGFGDVLEAAQGNASEVHLDERFLHTALAGAIPLNDGGLKGHAFEPWHVQRDFAGGCGKVVVVVTATVASARIGALIAHGLRQPTPPFPVAR